MFADLLYQNVRQPGAQSSQAPQLPYRADAGHRRAHGRTERLFTQGNIVQTENRSAHGSQGRGFFEILQPDGLIAYTRDGSFASTPTALWSRRMATAAAGHHHTRRHRNLTIGSDGTVSAS